MAALPPPTPKRVGADNGNANSNGKEWWARPGEDHGQPAVDLQGELQSLRRTLDRMSSTVADLQESQGSHGVEMELRAEIQAALTGERALILRELDARFEFLVRELSDRLVFLGNEIAALKNDQDVATDTGPTPWSGGPGIDPALRRLRGQ